MLETEHESETATDHESRLTTWANLLAEARAELVWIRALSAGCGGALLVLGGGLVIGTSEGGILIDTDPAREAGFAFFCMFFVFIALNLALNAQTKAVRVTTYSEMAIDQGLSIDPELVASLRSDLHLAQRGLVRSLSIAMLSFFMVVGLAAAL